MKKALILLLLLCLPVMAAAEMKIEADSRVIAPGEEIRVQVLGAPEEGCSYTLMKGKKTLFEGEMVPCLAGTFRPREAGDYTLQVTSGAETAALDFTVTADAAPLPSVSGADSRLYVDGSLGAVMRQGDVRQWTVYAPGPWTAETEDAFLQLSESCGGNGDGLLVTILPTAERREGQITFRSGEESLSVPIVQTAVHNREEETSFEAIVDYITIDGETVDTCFPEEDEIFFSVEASGAWTAHTDADFLTLTIEEDGLTLHREVQADTVQKGCVTLTCGLKNAYLYVYGVPEEKGADVVSVSVEKNQVRAWQESIRAEVITSADAEYLTVSAPGYEEIFPATHGVQTAEGLLWQVEVQINRGGEQTLLFKAEGPEGSGEKQMVSVQVMPEEAAFISEEGMLISAGDYHHLKFVTTAAAETVQLADARGQVLAAWEKQGAALAWAGPEGQKERYIAWDIALEKGTEPDMVLLGAQRIPVALQTVLTPEDIQLYSQTDGWWQDKKYSVSNLQQSGCAVFSLSHALQLLGYTGEEIRPENLAKTYAVALMKDGSGTMNSTLVGRAGDDFGFKTRYELYENPSVIADKAGQGAVFSFSVVDGHIACVARVQEEEGKCLIIDSAPSATFERKGEVPVYYRDGEGNFVEAATPAELPGAVYYPETDSYGCGVYYMELSYVAKRGVRLIQPK